MLNKMCRTQSDPNDTLIHSLCWPSTIINRESIKSTTVWLAFTYPRYGASCVAVMKTQRRFESRSRLANDCYRCRGILRWCFFVSVLLSIGIRPCATFLVETPSCVGRLSTIVENDANSTTTFRYHVIGTSHFRCDSHKEVSDLIRKEKPDGVVIELDPERLLRLTLDDATTRTRAMANTKADVETIIGERWFGGDFLSAIETSKEMDIPIFLGDEYPIETRQRFANTLLDAYSYRPDRLLGVMASFFRPREAEPEMLLVDVLGTFWEDPRKLLPLALTLSLPVVAVLLTILFEDATGQMPSSQYEALATALSLVASFVASCKVYNNLIVDRDDVLASNVRRAATTMALLKSKQLIRKRWTFTVEKNHDDSPEDTILSESIPLFTLKNPLEQNAVRNLNLFEPRWLKMIDRLLSKTTHPISDDSSAKDPKIIGCVTCTNKFYSAINAASDPSGFQEGRYADVIFRRRGRFGELTDVVEGSRPSGARKVGARILGKEAFDLSSSRDENGDDCISVVKEGYLAASGLQPLEEGEEISHTNVENAPKEINIVVVVGLLHANGVLDCLSRSETTSRANT